MHNIRKHVSFSLPVSDSHYFGFSCLEQCLAPFIRRKVYCTSYIFQFWQFFVVGSKHCYFIFFVLFSCTTVSLWPKRKQSIYWPPTIQWFARVVHMIYSWPSPKAVQTSVQSTVTLPVSRSTSKLGTSVKALSVYVHHKPCSHIQNNWMYIKTFLLNNSIYFLNHNRYCIYYL